MAHKVPTPPIHNFVDGRPNEEQIEKPKNYFFANPKKAQVFFKKFCMNDKITSKTNNSVE